jgi:SAM-dependent methyltransferase
VQETLGVPVPSDLRNTKLVSVYPPDSEWFQRSMDALFKIECDYAQGLINDIKQQKVTGAFVEFGVFQGRWLKLLSEMTERAGLGDRPLWGFDSFRGLSSPHSAYDTSFWKEGMYAASRAEVERNLDTANHPRIKLVEGFFAESLKGQEAARLGDVAYARIDCDIYEPAVESLAFLSQRLSHGAVLAFDDWTHDIDYGETRAFAEWVPKVPHLRFEFLCLGPWDHIYLRVWHRQWGSQTPPRPVGVRRSARTSDAAITEAVAGKFPVWLRRIANPKGDTRYGGLLVNAVFRRDPVAQGRVLRAAYRRLPLTLSGKTRLREWLISRSSLLARLYEATPRPRLQPDAKLECTPTLARSVASGSRSAQAGAHEADAGASSEGLLASAGEVEVDWTVTYDYPRLRDDEINEYSNIEVTENLREGGIHAQKAWGYWFRYLSDQVMKTSLTDEILRFCEGVSNPQILSLGCGYGGIELEIAQSLRSPYQITAVDINPGILARAGIEAREKKLNIQFQSLDLNFVEIPEKAFDLIFAHASLHHLVNLEHVFAQIYKGLRDHGRLIVQDVIGKTQVLFWKENVDFAIDLVQQMPREYSSGIHLAPYSEPAIQRGMEGIRQEEIEPLLSAYFTPIKMFKYGSFMRMICTHPDLGKRLDPDIEADRLYLQRLFELDVCLVREGKLRPTEMLAVYEKKDSVDSVALTAQARARLHRLWGEARGGTGHQPSRGRSSPAKASPEGGQGRAMRGGDTRARGAGEADYLLPVFNHIPDGIRRGRNVRDGYSRGWGLQIGGLRAKIAADPLYQEALALAAGRTMLSEENRMNIFLLLRFFVDRLPMGHIVEYGSFKGGNAIFMAKVCSALHPGMRVYAFDTYEGMPETDMAVDAHHPGDFADAGYQELSEYIDRIGVANLELVRGLFEDTAPRVLPMVRGIRLAHIDCDIRTATAFAYEVSIPYMVPGGYLVLDDALVSSCLGATEVVEELMIRRDGLHSEQVYPQYVFRAFPRT